MKEKIRQVMKFSGPRMLIYDPKLAFKHIGETIRCRKKQKKETKQNAKNKN